MMNSLSRSLFVIAAAAAPAAADEITAPQPVMPNVLSTQTGGSIDVRLDYTNIDDNEGTIFGATLWGQYLTPGGLGGYVQLPYGHLSFDELDDSFSGFGNLELGGLYVARNSPELDLYVRGGLALDTASDEGLLAAPTAQSLPRITEAFPSGFNSEWLRGHGGLRTRGPIAFGVEAGVDFPLGDGFDGEIDALFVAAGSISIAQPGFSISGGLALIQTFGAENIEGDDDEENLLNLNATVDFLLAPKVRGFVATGFNLDEADDDLAFSLGAGLRLGL
jgi:hypothetical protein